MSTRLLPCVLVAAALLSAACARSREIERELRLLDVETGWYDAGIVEGGLNKLVPTVTFRVQNASDRAIARVQLYAIFRRAEEDVVWGEQLVQGIDREGLAAGATGEPLVIRSNLGYTGEQARAEMLHNREFVDVRVEIMGKHGPRTWVTLAEYPIERTLMAE